MLLRALQGRRTCFLRLEWVWKRRSLSALVHINSLRVLSRWALQQWRPPLRYHLVHHRLYLDIKVYYQVLRLVSRPDAVLLGNPVRRRLMVRRLMMATVPTRMLPLSLTRSLLSSVLCIMYFAVN
jgi:hypothetical protein